MNNPLEQDLKAARVSIQILAYKICDEFISNRAVRRDNREEFSDLVVKVDLVNQTSLRVEWRQRRWRRPYGGKGSRRYDSIYLKFSEVLRAAKPFEREEVEQTRNQLRALQEAHSTLLKMEKQLRRLGLLRCDEDRQADFWEEGILEPRDPDTGRFIPDPKKPDPKKKK